MEDEPYWKEAPALPVLPHGQLAAFHVLQANVRSSSLLPKVQGALHHPHALPLHWMGLLLASFSLEGVGGRV